MRIDLTDDELSLIVATLSATANSLCRAADHCHRNPDYDPDFDPREARIEAGAMRVLSNRLVRSVLNA